jgi:hypothetical protein
MVGMPHACHRPHAGGCGFREEHSHFQSPIDQEPEDKNATPTLGLRREERLHFQTSCNQEEEEEEDIDHDVTLRRPLPPFPSFLSSSPTASSRQGLFQNKEDDDLYAFLLRGEVVLHRQSSNDHNCNVDPPISTPHTEDRTPQPPPTTPQPWLVPTSASDDYRCSIGLQAILKVRLTARSSTPHAGCETSTSTTEKEVMEYYLLSDMASGLWLAGFFSLRTFHHGFHSLPLGSTVLRVGTKRQSINDVRVFIFTFNHWQLPNQES